MTYDFHRNLVVRESPGRGRGVFARRSIARGEQIEAAPVTPIPADESRSIRAFSFSDNLYEWEELPSGEWTLALVCGVGLLFNHSFEPNADYDRDHARRLIVYTALRPIREGEEIFINYNGDPESQEPLRFHVH